MGPHHWTQHRRRAGGATKISLFYFSLCELHHHDYDDDYYGFDKCDDNDDDDDKLNKQTQMKQQSLTIDCAGTCAAPLYLASQGK